ncbi:hypothetical protein ZIOFF_027402 [Zingiber officinale]|uniref:Transmembrane protein n=1 Tax=Zingiber officinale TaxID=94328 RepID=A0A8J5LDW3_ZINOF|nr:hypothetical protein ZIOFF_027402 [Zingiber officinale]
MLQQQPPQEVETNDEVPRETEQVQPPKVVQKSTIPSEGSSSSSTSSSRASQEDRAASEMIHTMERHNSDVSSANAVLLGALASGVNGPTWFVVKVTFLLLGLCLTAMLALAFSSSDFIIVGHVLLLVTIGVVLFLLIDRFIAETGLVSVEQQMHEMGVSVNNEQTKKDKRT